MAKTKKKEPVPEFPKVIETFSKPESWEFDRMKDSEPSCFNGWVSIKRYRITIEEIEEPIEVLQARLEDLWLHCDNWRHWQPLENAAKQLNYTFRGERGSKKLNK